MLELVDWSSLTNSSNNSSTKALSGNDTESSYKTANGKIDKHALIAVAGASPQSSENTSKNDNSGICQEARCDDKMLHLLNIGSGRLLGSVQSDDDSTNHTLKTTDLANETETFLEEDGRQYCSNDDTESTKRSDQDGVDKSVGHKIADFTVRGSALSPCVSSTGRILPYNHQDHSSPPPTILEVTIALASSLVVFLVCLEQSMLFQYK